MEQGWNRGFAGFGHLPNAIEECGFWLEVSFCYPLAVAARLAHWPRRQEATETEGGEVVKIIRVDSNAATVLVVDRDPLMLTAVASVLDMHGHRALLARTEEVAMKAIASHELDLIVLSIEDLEAGCSFAQRLRSLEKTRDLPVIFLVPQLTAQWSAKLHSHGGVYSLLQPVDPHALIDLVDRAVWIPHIAKSKLGQASSAQHVAKDWMRL